MFRIIRCPLEIVSTVVYKRYSIFWRIFHAVHSSALDWISLKSAKVCFSLLLLLFTTFASGCVQHLQTTLTTPPTYHFREVRWGSTKAAVMLAEQGKRVHFDKGNTLVYKHRHKDVPLLLIYCFQKNRLRAAGYLTANPATLMHPDRLFDQELLETLGEPTEILADGGMLWENNETLTYTNTYEAGNSNIDYSRIGISRPRGNILPSVQVRTNRLKRWHGVCAYIDMNFYRMLEAAEEEPAFTLAELSYYEEIMFGLFKEVSEKN